MSGLQDNSGRTIRVEVLARVEGEGAMDLSIRDGRVDSARLNIFEPPRFYEAFLRGRGFFEVPDITARICGICPVAYQMSACHALERALGIDGQISEQVRQARNLFYCGEWVESHVLHMFLLHLPDFFGVESAFSMPAEHRPLLAKALSVRAVGNRIVALLGGRSVHPVGACVGGFHRRLDAERAAELLKPVRSACDDMCELTLWLAQNVEFPKLERDYEFVALGPDDEYPMNRGPIVSSKGLRIDPAEFLNVIEERQVPHSTALHAVMKERGPYLVGPLARLNLSADRLHRRAGELLGKTCAAAGSSLPWRNNFLSLLARALEVVHALALAGDILESVAAQPRRLDNDAPPDWQKLAAPVRPRAGQGAWATEAPRGLLWHCYRTADDGTIADARIIPPTSQNQASIELDLVEYASRFLDLPDEQIKFRCEHMVRNYDPCISCSTHMLRIGRPFTRSASSVEMPRFAGKSAERQADSRRQVGRVPAFRLAVRHFLRAFLRPMRLS